MATFTGTTGDDFLVGASTDDVLDGKAGHDILNGGDGNDTLTGGAGNDVLIGGTGNDVAVFTGTLTDYRVDYNPGTLGFTIADKTQTRDDTDQLSSIENFQFADGTRSVAQMQAIAQDKAAPLLLSVVPGPGAVGVSVGANIVLTFSEAITRGAGIWRLLDANGALVESFDTATSNRISIAGSTLTLDPTADLLPGGIYSVDFIAGSVLDLVGNAFAGNPAFSFITLGTGPLVRGTTGNDSLAGGATNDTFVADVGDDAVDGGAGDDVIDGGRGNDSLIGGSGNDVLIGGVGADTLSGGTGTDTYYVADVGDLVVEVATETPALNDGRTQADLGRAVDKVIASINYTLTSFVENLTLASGSGGLAGVGNDLANFLQGNEGGNALAGGSGDDSLDGGSGADTLSGGTGADTYYVDNAGDEVTEVATESPASDGNGPQADLGHAVDKVIASINYTLTSFVENLTLASGSGSLAGVGNSLANELTGNESANRLTAGAGDDSIDGGSGIDTAVYTGPRANYILTLGSTVATVQDTRSNTGSEGADSLSNVERLKFSDGSLAIDTGADQAGGQVALLIGAVLGGGSLSSKQELIGVGLTLLDQGNTLRDLAGAVMRLPAEVWGSVAANGAQSATAAQIATYLLSTVNGAAPDEGTLNAAVGLLNNGPQGEFLYGLMTSQANQTQVNLTGLAGTGLAFLP